MQDESSKATLSGQEAVSSLSGSILTQAAQDAIFILDRAGNYLFINEAGARTLGVPSESMIGHSVREFFPADAAALLQTLESVIKTGNTVSAVQSATIAGKPVLFSAVLVPINDTHGAVDSVFVIARDITWIKRLARRARRNQRRITKLFRNMGEGVGIVDPGENFTFVNPAAHEIFGVPPGQLLNRNIREFVTEEGWREVIRQTALRKKGAGSRYELEICRPDGQHRFLRVTVTSKQSRSGKYLGAFGVFSDITRRKAAEEALRKTSEQLEAKVSERTGQLVRVVEELQRQIQETQDAVSARKVSQSRFRAIFDSALDAVFFKDRNCRYQEVNGGLERLFERAPAELVGKSDIDIFGEEDGQTMVAEDQRVLRGEVLDLESPTTINGTRRVIHVIKVPVPDSDGKIVGICGIARDITQRKVAEEELIGSRERLRQLTASLEHSREEEKKRISQEIHDELGQSLTVAKYELASLRKVIGAERPEIVSRLDTLDSRLDAVTQDIRRIAQNLRPPLLDHFGLQAAIQCLTKDFQGNTGIRCDFLPTTSTMDIEDSAAISVFRVCQEALTNAARHSCAASITVTLASDEGKLRLDIVDDGRGIKSEDLLKPTLGVLGMEERIRRLGGIFQIAPGQAGGTRVSLTIPMTKTEGRDIL